MLKGGGDADSAAAGGFGQHAGASGQGEANQHLQKKISRSQD